MTKKGPKKPKAMGKLTAASVLQMRRRRMERQKSGPLSLAFGPREIEAVRVLTVHGKTKETLARHAGLSIKRFNDAMEKDELLRDAWQWGKAERREKRIAELEKQSRAGSTKATELLLRYEHRDAGPRTKNERGGDTTININADSVAAQMDGRKFTAMLERVQKKTKREPTVIEHEPRKNPESVDPVRAALGKPHKEQQT